MSCACRLVNGFGGFSCITTIGWYVDLIVGLENGAWDGQLEGKDDGFCEGSDEGFGEGAMDGSTVGLKVGAREGLVGRKVGFRTGVFVVEIIFFRAKNFQDTLLCELNFFKKWIASSYTIRLR